MMNYHIVATLVYSTLFLLTILFNRTVIQNLISSQLKMIVLNFVNTFGFFMYLVIYYPRQLPQYFGVLYDDLPLMNSMNSPQRNTGSYKTYGLRLSLKSLTNQDDLFLGEPQTMTSYLLPVSLGKISNKEVNDIKNDKSIPVIIVNPLFKSQINKNDMNLLNHVNLGLRK